jgi:hypothetical protein
LISQYLYILAFAIPFFGFWALYIFLTHRNKERLAFWGLMGAILGTALPLATLGVLAHTSPIVGKLYLQGYTNPPQIISEIMMGSSMAKGIPGRFFISVDA